MVQCRNLDLPVYENFEEAGNPDLYVDAVFGFSFQGDVRDPFKEIVKRFEETTTPIVSVDIPSGWHVEQGPTEQAKFQPEVLVSLTAPKMCAVHFKGKHHFLGGRFVPSSLAKKFDFEVPEFPGADQVVELPAIVQ